MNTLQTFTFDTNAVRVYGTAEEPLFVAVDICKALGIENPTNAVGRLEADERITLDTTKGLSNNVELNAVNEAGLYRLVLESRKPEAKAFKRWLLHEVLPALRKFGGYASDANFRALHEALLLKKELLQEREQLNDRVKACDKEIRELQLRITNQTPAALISSRPHKGLRVSKEEVKGAFEAAESIEQFRGAANWRSIGRWWEKLKDGVAL